MPRGRRHRRRATPEVNGGHARGQIDAMEHRPCQLVFTNRFFFARKAAARGVNLNLRVDAIGHFRMVKKNNESNWEATPARWDHGESAESEFEQFMEHHLRDVKRRLCA